MELWFSEEFRGGWRLSVRVERVLATQTSPFQRIDVLQTRDYGKMLVIDGKVQACELDEFVYHEMLTHVTLLSHPEPRCVLVVGGGDGGTMRECLRHPSLQSGILAEIDEQVIELCQTHMPTLCAGVLDDSRVRVQAVDASEFVRTVRNLDAVLVDSSDPEGPSERLFTDEFYGQVRDALSPGGLVALQAGSPFFYTDQVDLMQAKLSQVFTHVRPYTIPMPTYPGGTWTLMVASRQTDPGALDMQTLEQRFRDRGLATRYYSPRVHQASLAFPATFR